ncbi:MAG: 30S ribosomal protein S6 [Simkaniaceae bacterium]|nr:30S ribosomal protein S6 [Candidatus Sacchlamyda saccharinae]
MPKSRKHLYEGMYILSATLSEDARKKAIEKITSSIQHHAGEVHKTFEQGRKKLAYEIDGRREGYYYVIYFTAESASMPELWREYQLNEDMIRFMTLRAEEVPESIEFKELALAE